jgi:RNA polymerase sigma-70 factor (ECF subfamily)
MVIMGYSDKELRPPEGRLRQIGPRLFQALRRLNSWRPDPPVPAGAESEPPEDLLQDVAVLVGLTDEELVARSVGGDTDCFNQLIKRWEKPIYALAYRTLGREEDARDVCQETFLRAFRALDGFKGQAKFSSWLYRIALNLCRDWLRRERRAPVVATPDGVDLVELAGEGAGVERFYETVARRDLSRAVARAMRGLPEDQRTAIVLKEYHGLTFQEISELLGCPLSTVKTRLYQGLTVLRRELEKNGIGSANGLAPREGASKPSRVLRAI